MMRGSILHSKFQRRNFSLKQSISSSLVGRVHRYSTVAPQSPNAVKKTTLLDIMKKYRERIPLSMVTAYDYTSAVAVDEAGIDIILVGDSAAMVMMGHENTTAVTLEEMIHHCKSVKRGSKRAFLLGDMPFGSYEFSPLEAARNAVRLMKEGQVEAVKMEGGKRIKNSIRAVVDSGIPVIGHIGLTPQTSSALGGFRVQGKTAAAAQQLLEDAQILQECGVKGIVIESVPTPVATHITDSISVPTIGIGAGNGTSGQVLVYHDMLGIYPNLVPKFSKQYLNLAPTIKEALAQFKQEVESHSFPTPAHSYTMKQEEFQKAFPTSTVHFPGVAAQPSAPVQEVVSKPTPAKPQSYTVTKNPKKRIAVIGGGSMGSLIGGKLASNEDNDVWMLTSWKEHVEKINTVGLTMKNLDQSERKISLNATTSFEEIKDRTGQVDLAIVLVKSLNTKIAAEKAAQIVHPTRGHILTLQNGLGNREAILEVFQDGSRVIQGVTSQASNMIESGYVRHTGEGLTTLAVDGANEQFVKELCQWLIHSGIPCGYSNDLESTIWGKLIVNASINPLSALLRVKNGVLADSKGCRDIMNTVVKEGVTVANARGVRLPYDNPLENVLAVARATGNNISSMLQDVLRGTPTEVNSINGAIVREGEKHGVNVALNKTLVGLLELTSSTGAQIKMDHLI